MLGPATDVTGRKSRKAAGRSGLLNSALGLIAFLVAASILAREWMGPDADRAHSARPSTLAILRWTRGPVFGIAWSPDGRRLAVSGFGPVVRVWEPESGSSSTLEGTGDRPRFALGWSGDGGRLIVGGLDVPVESWGCGPGRGREVLVRPGDGTSIAGVMADSTRGRTTRLWGAADGRLPLLPAACRSANTVAFAPDGRSMASGGSDGTLRLLDLETREVRWSFWTDGRGINSVAFSPDSSLMVSAGGGPVRVWDVATGEELARLGEALYGSATVAFSPDGRRLAEATWGGSIRIWDVPARRERARFQGHSGQVLALAWSPDGKTLASGGYDSTVRLWDVAGWPGLARSD